MNFSAGIQNISMPGEGPVYIRPVFNQAAIEPIGKLNQQDRSFNNPPANLKEMIENMEEEQFPIRGILFDIQA